MPRAGFEPAFPTITAGRYQIDFLAKANTPAFIPGYDHGAIQHGSEAPTLQPMTVLL